MPNNFVIPKDSVRLNGEDCAIVPIPFDRYNEMAQLIDDFVNRWGTFPEKLSEETIFQKIFEMGQAEIFKGLRFFVSVPEKITDEDLAKNLSMPLLIHIIEKIITVNRLKDVISFFGKARNLQRGIPPHTSP